MKVDRDANGGKEKLPECVFIYHTEAGNVPNMVTCSASEASDYKRQAEALGEVFINDFSRMGYRREVVDSYLVCDIRERGQPKGPRNS